METRVGILSMQRVVNNGSFDPTKIHRELGWLPETSFEEGIQKTIQWYLENKEWWQHILSREYRSDRK